MNQKRFNQMRSINRGQEQGLQQILQPSAAGQLPPPGGQGGNQGGQQSLRRKMTYTRTELLCRGLPTTQIPRRSPRIRGNTNQQPPVAVAPQTPLSAGHGGNNAQQAASTRPPQRSYLPRVSRLQSPNRNLTRMRTEIDLKPEPPVQVKKTPRVPNTPHASQCHIPFPSAGTGHRTSGIPILRNRVETAPKPRETKERIELVGITDTSSRSSSPVERSLKMRKPIALPGNPQNKSFVYLCKPVKKVKELLTARQLRHSCENLELAGFGEGKLSKLQKTNSEEQLHSKAIEQGLELSSITEMSITPTSSTISQLNQPHQQLHHHHQLQLHQLPQLQLQQNPKQLEDNTNNQEERLLSQLNELRQRQQYLCQKEQRQKEMDMVCQNLPTLQHEIRLLQELNEKLETTLRGSNAAKQRNYEIECQSLRNYEIERQSSTAFYTPRCGPMLFMEMPLREEGFLLLEQRARITLRVNIMAFAHNLAVVREFRIETKTLNELKASDETQCFYLPKPKLEPLQTSLVDITSSESNPPPLQCTNLRMLRENPDVLIQQLRRGGGGGGAGAGGGSSSSYSLLDHDMFMFINSLSKKSESEGYLYSSLAVGVPSKDNLGFNHYHQLPALQSPELQGKLVYKQVNSTTQTDEDVELKEQKEPKENIEKTQKDEQKEEQQKEEQLPVVDAPKSLKKKMKKLKPKARIIKRSPIQSNVEPKVRLKLFKTVLVGFVQVAVFLVLIMAFMYPDASC